MKEEKLHLIELQAQNMLCFDAICIKPTGHVTTIGGNNGAGKSSACNLIALGLGGKKRTGIQRPVKDGAEKGEIVQDFGSLRIRRVFYAEGREQLTITDNDGRKYSSPQSLLDEFRGELFDPQEFANLPADKQVQILRSLVGLDTTEIEEQIQDLYQKRTDVNRDVKRFESHLSSLPHHPDVPEAEESTEELLSQLTAAAEANRKAEDARHRVERLSSEYTAIQIELEELQKRELKLRDRLVGIEEEGLQAEAELEKIATVDTTSINERIRNAEAVNRKVRENWRRAEVEAELENSQKKASDLTTQIEDLRTRKREMTEAATFPVDGLGFDDSGVTWNGIPLSQAAESERVVACMGIGVALRPQLPLFTIKNGSGLGPEARAKIEQAAREHDVLVLLEVLGEEGASVVIRDGGVVS